MIRNLLLVATLLTALPSLPRAHAQERRPSGGDAQTSIRRLEEQLEQLRKQIHDTETALKEAKAKAEKEKRTRGGPPDMGRGRGPSGFPGMPGAPGLMGAGGFGRGRGPTPPEPPSKARPDDINAKLDRITRELEEIRRELRNRR